MRRRALLVMAGGLFVSSLPACLGAEIPGSNDSISGMDDSNGNHGLTGEEDEIHAAYKNAYDTHTSAVNTMDELVSTAEVSDEDPILDELETSKATFAEASMGFAAVIDLLDPDDGATNAMSIAEDGENIAAAGEEFLEQAVQMYSSAQADSAQAAAWDNIKHLWSLKYFSPETPTDFKKALENNDVSDDGLRDADLPDSCPGEDDDVDFQCAEGDPIQVETEIDSGSGRLDLACHEAGAEHAIRYTRPRLETRSGLSTGIGGPGDEIGAHFSVYVGDHDDGPEDPVSVQAVRDTAPAFVESTVRRNDEIHDCTVPVYVSTFDHLETDD